MDIRKDCTTPIETINPNYYFGTNGLETRTVIEEFNLNFNKGNAVKYILRSGKKTLYHEGVIEDLQKAITYLTFEIERLKK